MDFFGSISDFFGFDYVRQRWKMARELERSEFWLNFDFE
jgi:hypothetical protein